ncbi:MAG: NADH-quinone oxidoreductase subunit F [Deltaproteobacteria bacterium]|nr:MAG: NADH-quinone oxidoreductase subunit F [Deltaproteobacteria bacterium]
MEKHGAQRHRILALLKERGGLTRENAAAVSRETGIPEADVFGAGAFYELLSHPDVDRRVCQGLSCQLAGASEIEGMGVSCLGQCDRAPVAIGKDLHVVHYGRARGGITPDDPSLPMNLGGEDRADYAALHKARALGTDGVIAELKASGLQGRGGAGFPAHLKWASVASQPETERYVVCNADEGEPGTFKDREVMLRRPHLLVEGLAIAAEAVGAKTLFVYVRGEFPEERASFEQALDAASEHVGHLDWRLIDGHGAYICGEETALIESIEGRRGMPRHKPPYPTVAGLWGKPTLMNNVETLACVPDIVLRGGQRFRDLGRTEAGTKLYCISGHVQEPGVYELPLGITLTELVEAAGGYLGTPRAFSPGGASSGFLPMSFADTPLDFGTLGKLGSMLGSAGVVVLDDSVDMAEAARWQAVFYEDESCGQCAPCRLGTQLVRKALDTYLVSGDPADLGHIDDVAWEMEEGSICGLGMIAALPLQTARKHFPEDFGPR